MHHSNLANMHGGGGAIGGGGGIPPGPGPLHRHQMHQPMPPHQMHHDNRHPMGLSQPNSMGSVGQSMGGMGQSVGGMGQPMGIPPPLHGPARPLHQIRPMAHHAPALHHNAPMKTMRRPYNIGGSYSSQAALQPPPPYQQAPQLSQHPAPPPQHVEVSADCAVLASEPSEAASGPGAESADGGAAQGGGEATRPSAATGPPTTNALANSKEKTPMCLVNELARYNKIKHQYRLTSETGPAHKKIFTVTLRLGENEEYTAEGSSIKRAQHAAATAALARTRHTFPPPKHHSHHSSTHAPSRYTGAVMPTVELNALAMKLCKPAVYTPVPPVPAPPLPPPGARFPRFRTPYPPYPPRFHPPHPGAYAPPYTQRGMCNMTRGVAPVYRVRVSVGESSWSGEGPTPQAARHDAAARALVQLREQVPLEPTAAVQAPAVAALVDKDMLDIKSPVSLVHELALKEGLPVVFNVKSERGPPHMRVFITTCTVGELEVEGEGNGKKMSKKRAAECMVEAMRDRWSLAMLSERTRLVTQQRVRRKPVLPKKPRNLIKENGEACSETSAADSADNPISRLAMARHAERARSPQYSVLEERGAPRRREFVVRCDAAPHQATGVGPNKKTAKRRAAHNVLIAMGLDTPGSSADAATKPTNNSERPADSKLRNEPQAAGGAGAEVRQPVPGVLLVPDYSHRASAQPDATRISETAATGSSGSVGAGEADADTGVTLGGPPGAKDQLIYLSQLLGFNVQFSDFPKRNHGEYLSLVALSTVPPVMCHGAGASTQQSHEQSSRAALRALASMGLDAVTHDTPTQPVSGANPKAGRLSNGLID